MIDVTLTLFGLLLSIIVGVLYKLIKIENRLTRLETILNLILKQLRITFHNPKDLKNNNNEN